MSKTVASIIEGFINFAVLPINSRNKAKTFARVLEYLDKKGMTSISTNRGDMQFFTHRGAGMASTIVCFGKDEPETIEWIDNFIEPGDLVWDIGSNVGIYSIYIALKNDVKVMAFEPSALNYKILIEHIALNKMDKRVSPLCVALSNKNEIAHLEMSNMETGHAGQSIGVSSNQNTSYKSVFSQAVPAITANDFCKIFNQPIPTHIKLDVDGIEPYIIEGASEILPKVKSIIVEVEGRNLDNVNEYIEKPLMAAGFKEDISYRNKGKGRNRVYLNTRMY